MCDSKKFVLLKEPIWGALLLNKIMFFIAKVLKSINKTVFRIRVFARNSLRDEGTCFKIVGLVLMN
ncbi:hypothetical protein HW45_10875 [Vibrio sp. ER1A]|nr:hypothetical protein HW45_10875 [Vibrio sp. ER1A]